ncbi:hypothetical protein [Hymenobacter chitinivorans]|uniref:hypothetical protein n=1 Tax=Hymenobacter chitinivorans TaxID=89969 RepID=UPI0014767F6C|nr:hypothetical protein [Hymenobacter chitinivorans]
MQVTYIWTLMLFIALLVGLVSLWMAWPGLRRTAGTSPVSYALRWGLFGLLLGSTLFLLYLFYGLKTGAGTH